MFAKAKERFEQISTMVSSPEKSDLEHEVSTLRKEVEELKNIVSTLTLNKLS